METIIKRFDTGMHYVLIPENKALEFLDNNQKRIIARINKSTKIHCAIMHSKEKGYFFYIGNKILKQLKLKEADTISIEISIDNSEMKFEFPEELKEVLNTDIEAKAIFDGLTDGNKRSLIYLVIKVKSSDKRIEKSLKIAEHLKNGITSARKIKF